MSKSNYILDYKQLIIQQFLLKYLKDFHVIHVQYFIIYY